MMRRPSSTLSGFVSVSLSAVLLMVSLFGCGQGEEPVRVDLSKREETGYTEDRDTITYGYLPQYLHRVSYERHQPVIEYLKRETGLPIRQIFSDTFDEHMKMVGQGKIDISYCNPFSYVKIAHRFGASAFARVIEIGGKEFFRGQIIARKDDNRIQSLEDCRGKRWIAVDASSAGGYLWALGLFWDHGIRKEHFAELAFAPGPGGKQEKVVLAVHAGRYDIGSIREGTLDVVSDKLDVSEIKVIAYTDWYPGWVYAARKGLDPQIVNTIKSALLRLDCTTEEHKPICEAARFNGVISAENGNYDSVRELAAKVGMDLNH